MAKFSSITLLDGGTDYARTLAATASRVKMHVIKAYAVSDSYATVIANLHIAIVDSTGSSVLYVADETTDQALTSGNTFKVPAFTYDVNQPT
jgi:hypothetical protein